MATYQEKIDAARQRRTARESNNDQIIQAAQPVDGDIAMSGDSAAELDSMMDDLPPKQRYTDENVPPELVEAWQRELVNLVSGPYYTQLINKFGYCMLEEMFDEALIKVYGEAKYQIKITDASKVSVQATEQTSMTTSKQEASAISENAESGEAAVEGEEHTSILDASDYYDLSVSKPDRPIADHFKQYQK